ncbi:MAG: YegP family protein [Gaiellales bacterium]
MPAKFVVKKGSTGKFRFNLLSTNGQVIASSQTYETKASCMAGLRAVQKHAGGAVVDDLTVAKPAAMPAAKKPAAKKPAAKAAAAKPAAKKAPARKPAAKKPAAKKPAARKR